ncbi:hypothetical protein [Microbacterium cremeum]|uniref:hypothetical protein n=1 Tax=Microbacterium cremeum TaxID=2782169 RepID=UPI001886C2B0|nr:hypothetical protein [Microbacterium cremeum]
MITNELTWSDGNGHNRVHVIDPETTEVKAIAAAGQELIEAHAEFKAINRERTAAQDDPRRLAHEAKVAAKEAGRAGKTVDTKKLRKKVREAEEHLEELDLEWEAANGKLRSRRLSYLAAVEHHVPALAAEAKGAADASILALASASQTAKRAETQVTNSLAILAALAETKAGGEFTPKPQKARREMADDFGEGGVPGVYVAIARTNLSKAIAYATRILGDLKAAEAEAAKREKFDAEVEASPDLDDDDDDTDGGDDGR